MEQTYDAIIVGGGHNGLTSAGYLAKAGFKTLVLEKRPILGGSCVTEEIHPGYKVSTISYIVSLLRDEVVRDLALKQHGFEMIKMGGKLVICGDEHMFLTDDEDENRKAVGQFSSSDYDAMLKFDGMIQDIGAVVRKTMMVPPPKLDAGIKDLFSLAKLGFDVKKLSPDQRHRLIQIFTSSAYDIINRWFESPMIKNMYLAACFSGNFASLRQPGSALPFFSMAVGELEGELGAWRLVKGGMGAIVEAMASFARSKGCDIRTDSPVSEILVSNGKAVGVKLEGGDVFHARCVGSWYGESGNGDWFRANR